MKTSQNRYKFKRFEFWAADGMVAILDTEKAGSTQLSVEEATVWKRPGQFLLDAMGAAAILSAYDKLASHKLLEDACACAKEAHRQGNITNPIIARQLYEENKPAQILVGGTGPVRLGSVVFPVDDPLAAKYIEEFRKLRQKNPDPCEVLFKGYKEFLDTVEKA